MKTAFINGDYFPLSEAKISIFDRGLLFGDGIYEVLPVYNGQVFFLDRHLKRLESNLDKIKIPMPNCDWQNMITQLITQNGSGDLQVYIQITRGDQGQRKHDIPSSLKPTLFAFTIHNKYPTLEEKLRGLKAKLLEDIRWLRCDIKSTSLLGNILLNDEAVSTGFQTSILMRDNQVTEGSTTNVFIVTQDGTIKTPPLNHLCLPGITREIAVELIQQLGWPLLEESFSCEELFAAKEVWAASTTKEIFPITQIDDKQIADGQAGAYWLKINELYNNLKN
ncbi:MAG: D-amino acid aminotransferase [Legionella sp.]|nr:MAG: D-amino acid aminotransferase [Legionella sp.]